MLEINIRYDFVSDEVVIDKSNESVTNHYDSSDDFSKIHSSSKDVSIFHY